VREDGGGAAGGWETKYKMSDRQASTIIWWKFDWHRRRRISRY
jgi:hypothetical protein